MLVAFSALVCAFFPVLEHLVAFCFVVRFNLFAFASAQLLEEFLLRALRHHLCWLEHVLNKTGFTRVSKIVYSEDPNTGLVQYSKGGNKSGFEMFNYKDMIWMSDTLVRFLAGIGVWFMAKGTLFEKWLEMWTTSHPQADRFHLNELKYSSKFGFGELNFCYVGSGFPHRGIPSGLACLSV